MIIADFRREYNIDLYRNSHEIVNEEFYMLLFGLSAESRFINVMAEKYGNTIAHNTTERIEVTNPREFMQAIGK